MVHQPGACPPDAPPSLLLTSTTVRAAGCPARNTATPSNWHHPCTGPLRPATPPAMHTAMIETMSACVVAHLKVACSTVEGPEGGMQHSLCEGPEGAATSARTESPWACPATRCRTSHLLVSTATATEDPSGSFAKRRKVHNTPSSSAHWAAEVLLGEGTKTGREAQACRGIVAS